MNTRLLTILSVFLSLASLGKAAVGQNPEADILYRHQAVGAKSFMLSDQGTVFRGIWKLPQTVIFGRHLATNLSLVIHGQVSQSTNPPSVETAQFLRSALIDLVDNESLVDIRNSPSGTEWTLAIQLPEARRKIWDQGLRSWLKSEKLGEVTSASWAGFTGAKAAVSRGQFSWVVAQDWLLLGLGSNAPALWEGALAEIKSTQRPVASLTSNAWFKVNADFGKLRRTFPLIPEFLDAKLALSLAGKGESVRTDGTLQFAKPLDWTPEPWEIPTNIIYDPLVGFAAARGIAPLLAYNEDAKKLGITSFPNQMIGWSLTSVPYLTFAAFPQTGASNLLWNTFPQVPNLITNYGKLVGEMSWVSNLSQIFWSGLPFMNPTVRAIKSEGREYVLGGLLPPLRSRHKAPAELFEFTSRTNLAFYDWEITETRVKSWNRIVQSSLIGFFREVPTTNAPTQALIEALSATNRLGNAITEITVTGPSELTLMRQSHIGLTGLEIVQALRWVDSANFPFTFDRAPALDFKRHRKQAQENRTNSAANPPVPSLRPPIKKLPQVPTPKKQEPQNAPPASPANPVPPTPGEAKPN